jgi:hypothetical protein
VQNIGKNKWIACVDGISRHYVFNLESFCNNWSKYFIKMKIYFLNITIGANAHQGLSL